MASVTRRTPRKRSDALAVAPRGEGRPCVTSRHAQKFPERGAKRRNIHSGGTHEGSIGDSTGGSKQKGYDVAKSPARPPSLFKHQKKPKAPLARGFGQTVRWTYLDINQGIFTLTPWHYSKNFCEKSTQHHPALRGGAGSSSFNI